MPCLYSIDFPFALAKRHHFQAAFQRQEVVRDKIISRFCYASFHIHARATPSFEDWWVPYQDALFSDGAEPILLRVIRAVPPQLHSLCTACDVDHLSSSGKPILSLSFNSRSWRLVLTAFSQAFPLIM